MSKQILPGIEYLGYPYDVTEYYADDRSVKIGGRYTPLFKVQMANWDPNKDPNAVLVKINDKSYYRPVWMSVASDFGGSYENYSMKSLSEFSLKLGASVSATGLIKAFQLSVEANFSNSYSTNSSFYRMFEQFIRNCYRANMATSLEALRLLLNTQAKEDINGTMKPKDLIKKYGTFFLSSGIYGGAITYGQSIQKYAMENKTQASVSVGGHLIGGLSGGNVTSETSIRNKSSYTQSQANVECKGGDGNINDLEKWVNSVDNGKFSLIDFLPESLQPISVLADDPTRQEAIDLAIQEALSFTVPAGLVLKWDIKKISRPINVGEGGAELTMKVEPNELIVGYAAGANSEQNISRMALKVLDLNSNTTSWRTHDNTPFNFAGYEVLVDIPTDSMAQDNQTENKAGYGDRAVALVGVDGSVSEKGNNVTLLKAFYQILDPIPKEATSPSYLSTQVKSITKSVYELDTPDVGNGKNWQAPYNPGNENAEVIVSLGIRSNNNKLGFQIRTAPLMLVEEDIE